MKNLIKNLMTFYQKTKEIVDKGKEKVTITKEYTRFYLLAEKIGNWALFVSFLIALITIITLFI